MEKFDQLIDKCKRTFSEKMDRSDYDEALLTAIAQSLGPSIYTNDGSKVACSKDEEKEYIKENFLKGTLGLSEEDKLDEAIESACQAMGSSNRMKYRPVFYYLLVEHYAKEAHFLKVEAEKTKDYEEAIEDALHDEDEQRESKTTTGQTPHDIIQTYALYAAGAGFIPIPLIDLASISSVQYKMIKRLSAEYKIPFDKKRAESAIAAILGGTSSFELGWITRFMFKRVPIIGPIIGGTAVSTFAYASTKVIGNIFNDHFKTGGDMSLEDITMIKMKETFRMNMKVN